MSQQTVKQSISIFDIKADAEATNRGFVVQYLEGVREWIEAYGSKKDIFIEVHEDISVVDPDLGQNIFRQVKSYYSKPLGFGDREVKHSLYLFYRNARRLLGNGGSLRGCEFVLYVDGKPRSRDRLMKDWAAGVTVDEIEAKEVVRESVVEELSRLYDQKRRDMIRNSASQQELDVVEMTYLGEMSETDSFDWSVFVSCLRFVFDSRTVRDRHSALVSYVEQVGFTTVPADIVVARCFQETAVRASHSDPLVRVLSQDVLEEILNETQQQMLSSLSDDNLGKRILVELAEHSEILRAVAGHTALIPEIRNLVVDAKTEIMAELGRYQDAVGRPTLSMNDVHETIEWIEEHIIAQETPSEDEKDDRRPPDDVDEKLQANGLADEDDIVETVYDAYEDFAQVTLYLRGTKARLQQKVFNTVRRLYGVRKDRGESPRQIFNGLIEDITPQGASDARLLASAVLIAYIFHVCGVFKRASTR